MKRIFSIVALCALMFVSFVQPHAQAAAPIKIYIDGSELYVDQAPVMRGGRVLVPMRAIFEALDASVSWNPKTQTVVATKDGTSVTLKIGSTTAKINDKTVILDVPALTINGRTVVPVRFASTALGQEVVWDAASQSVFVKRSDSGAGTAVSNVAARIVGQNGDGRDVEVSFSKLPNETKLYSYRVMLVKTRNVYSFDLSVAQSVSSGNYTTLYKNGKDQRVTLNAQSRDVDGDLIRAGESYTAFVLAVSGSGNVLSDPAQTITIPNGQNVQAVTNVKASDTNDYGDGRDLEISFTKAQNESNISLYRIMVVKTKDANGFDAAAANRVANDNAFNVYKTGSNIAVKLNASARDTSGETIKNGVPYTVFVLSVSNTNADSKLSSGASVTLGVNVVGAPAITKVEDVSDYGDGRDLQVSFNKSSDESKINFYRIFVVKSANSFTLTDANKVSYGNYYEVAKNGSNRVVPLPSGARDVQGNVIRNGEKYRVYVLAVGNAQANNNNALSSASAEITLAQNANVGAATNVRAYDVYDYNDGRDLLVTFDKAPDESRVKEYRVFVVKTGSVSQFDLNKANAVSSSNYTVVNKNSSSSNQSVYLQSYTRDTDGLPIRSGYSYQVFVMSVGNSNQTYNNALSTPSSSITLNSAAVVPVTNVRASDNGDNGNGSDLNVTFDKSADESRVSEYRVFVVKSSIANQFNLTAANNLTSTYYYTPVGRTGYNLNVNLPNTARDTQGELIRNDVSYQVFVMAVSNSGQPQNNALSTASAVVTLTSYLSVNGLTVADVNDTGTGQDLSVSFNRVADEWRVSEYRVFVVRTVDVPSFSVTKASNYNNSYYMKVNNTRGNLTQALPSNLFDTSGQLIKNGVSYQVFILAVTANSSYGPNTLTGPSNAITLTGSAVSAVTNVAALDVGDNGDGRDLQVSFNKVADETTIDYYRVFVVKANQAGSFNLSAANAVKDGKYFDVYPSGTNPRFTLASNMRDVDGANITNGSYYVFVLSVGAGNRGNTLAMPGTPVTIGIPVAPVSSIVATVGNQYGDGRDVTLTISKPAPEGISGYRIIVVPSSVTLDLLSAKSLTSNKYTLVQATFNGTVQLGALTPDYMGNVILVGNDYKYKVYVLSEGSDGRESALSAASNIFSITAPVPAPAVTNLTVADVGSTGTGADLSITISKPDETNIANYEVMVAEIDNLKPLDATSVSAENYMKLDPIGNNSPSTINFTLSKTINGIAIKNDTQYYVYVLSVSKSNKAEFNTLSAPAAIKLATP